MEDRKLVLDGRRSLARRMAEVSLWRETLLSASTSPIGRAAIIRHAELRRREAVIATALHVRERSLASLGLARDERCARLFYKWSRLHIRQKYQEEIFSRHF